MSTATISRTDIPLMGASEMAAAIRSGDLTPLEIATVLLERIAAHDGKVRAFSHLERETVLIEAEALTNEAKEGKFRGPFHGVPFGVKEQFLAGGIPTLYDYLDPSPAEASFDATVIQNLKDAGALFMGKLFMVGPSGTPPSRNPWNIHHSPGGSSSGSGAAVGARFLPFALSEQTGGSGLRPAAYCGVSALKPTYGRNSRRGMFAMAWSQDHACIIATTIREVANVFALTAGPDPLDTSSRADGAYRGHETLSRPPKIGVVRNYFPELTDAAMNDVIDASAKQLADAGAEVVDFYLPDVFELVAPASGFVMLLEGSVIDLHEADIRAKKGQKPVAPPSAVTPTKGRFYKLDRRIANFIPATYYLQCQRIRRHVRDTTDAAIEAAGLDAILMATAPCDAPGNPVISGDPSLLNPWSHLGNPAISIPASILSTNNMPLGLQLVSPTMTDEHLLGVGAWCQDVLGLLDAPELP